MSAEPFRSRRGGVFPAPTVSRPLIADALGLRTMSATDALTSRGILVSDVLVVAVSLVTAHVVRFGTAGAEVVDSDIAYSAIGIALSFVWLFSLTAVRSRERRILGIGIAEYQRVTRATALTFGGLAVVALVVQIDVARGYLAVAFPLGLVLLLLTRYLWRSWLIAQRRDGRLLTDSLIVGSQADTERVLRHIERNRAAGYRAAGVAVTTRGDDGDAIALDGAAALDPQRFAVDELAAVVRQRGVGAVIVAGDLPGGARQVRELAWCLERSGVEMILVSGLTDVAGPRLYLRSVDGLPLVHVDLPQYGGTSHVTKRVLDVVLAAGALAVLALPMLIVAILIKLDSPGPIIYRQERVGINGSRFPMLKFRSMVTNADELRAEIASRNETDGLMFKMREDPRITRIGRWLRRYSIDELPQFVNVLRGDMSVVGPRPPLPVEVAQYEDRVNRRLLIRPGVTGLWQVSGRSNLPWEEAVRLDLYYVENWSVISDMIILLKTARAVVSRDGAY